MTILPYTYKATTDTDEDQESYYFTPGGKIMPVAGAIDMFQAEAIQLAEQVSQAEVTRQRNRELVQENTRLQTQLDAITAVTNLSEELNDMAKRLERMKTKLDAPTE